MIFQFLRAFHSSAALSDLRLARIKSWRWMALIRFHDTFWNSLWLWTCWISEIWPALLEISYSEGARAKCNREVGSQIENLRVVIVITGQRFILLDSTNRSAKMHRNETENRRPAKRLLDVVNDTWIVMASTELFSQKSNISNENMLL